MIKIGSYVHIKSVKELRSYPIWADEIEECGTCFGIPTEFIERVQGKIYKVMDTSGHLQDKNGNKIAFGWHDTMLKKARPRFNKLLAKGEVSDHDG